VNSEQIFVFAFATLRYYFGNSCHPSVTGTNFQSFFQVSTVNELQSHAHKRSSLWVQSWFRTHVGSWTSHLNFLDPSCNTSPKIVKLSALYPWCAGSFRTRLSASYTGRWCFHRKNPVLISNFSKVYSITTDLRSLSTNTHKSISQSVEGVCCGVTYAEVSGP